MPLGNCSNQLLLFQDSKEIPFIAETLQLSEGEASELARLKTVKGPRALMLWLNGTRGRGKVALGVGPTEYWAFTSDPTEVTMREAEIKKHDGNVWAAIAALARRGTRAHRAPHRGIEPEPATVAEEVAGWAPPASGATRACHRAR